MAIVIGVVTDLAAIDRIIIGSEVNHEAKEIDETAATNPPESTVKVNIGNSLAFALNVWREVLLGLQWLGLTANSVDR